MIVLDASALLEALLRTPAGEMMTRRLSASGQALHGPHLVDVEVTHAVRRLLALGNVNGERAREIIADLAAFPMRRHAHVPLLQRVWELRNNLSAYDAVYVALAEALEATLLTRDGRLANAPGHDAGVELV